MPTAGSSRDDAPRLSQRRAIPLDLPTRVHRLREIKERRNKRR
jgi:hypothetical protein